MRKILFFVAMCCLGGFLGEKFGWWGVICAVGLGWFVGAMLGSASKTSELILRAKKTKFTPGGSTEPIDVFEVQFKGDVVVPEANTEVDFVLRLRDCTGGKRSEEGDDVLTSEDSLSVVGNNVLSPVSTYRLESKVNEYKVWTQAFVVPLDCCIFPYRGIREFEFELYVKDRNDNVLAFSSQKKSICVGELGYIDRINFQEKTEEIALKLVHVLVNNNSGYFTQDTTRVVNDWINSRSELRDGDYDKSAVKQRLMTVFSKIKNSTLTLSASSVVFLARELSDNTWISDKYDFMTFFLRVVASFDDISTDDFKLLDLISAELGLDNEEYQEAKRKCLPLYKTEESDPFALLGISSTLSAQEKKDKLGELYEKWINVTTHDDPEMRRKAEMMVNTIAECRKNISLH